MRRVPIATYVFTTAWRAAAREERAYESQSLTFICTYSRCTRIASLSSAT